MLSAVFTWAPQVSTSPPVSLSQAVPSSALLWVGVSGPLHAISFDTSLVEGPFLLQ